jgi:hypothetical protein
MIFKLKADEIEFKVQILEFGLWLTSGTFHNVTVASDFYDGLVSTFGKLRVRMITTERICV